jgi:hypothetical protein
MSCMHPSASPLLCALALNVFCLASGGVYILTDRLMVSLSCVPADDAEFIGGGGRGGHHQQRNSS